MSNIYWRRPVNKSASLVTSQDGCSDTFLLDGRERLKVMGARKIKLQDLCVILKEEIGIDGRGGTGRAKKFPKHILLHPRYKEYRRVSQELHDLGVEINQLRSQLPKEARSFEDLFINLVKEKHPKIYEEIKQQAWSILK